MGYFPQLVKQYYPAFKVSLEEQEQNLPSYIQREFDDFLCCGRLEYGFLRVRCEDCHYERLVAFSWPLLRIPAPTALAVFFKRVVA